MLILISFFLGIDRQLAEHIAHLFIRDPISVFKEKLDQDDKNDTDHFEVNFKSNYLTLVSAKSFRVPL